MSDLKVIDSKPSEPVGKWLQIGGEQGGNLFGGGRIMVRVSNGGVTWEWRALTDEQVGKLLALTNAALKNERGELL
jgi:hypothetical protein